MKWLIVVACALSQALVNAQCDENSCTALCYPVSWQRDLCEFYQQLSQWRTSVAACGLTLPPLPQNRPGLVTEVTSGGPGLISDVASPVVDQWRIAASYWEEVSYLWETRYGSRQPSVSMDTTQPPPSIDPNPSTDGPSDFLTPNDIFSGSGSGDFTTNLPTMATVAMTTEEPTTAEPVTAAPILDNDARWTVTNQRWELLFREWIESTRQGAGLKLPTDLNASTIIAGYHGNERADRGAWSQLASFWQENLAAYEESYDGVCPKAVI